MSDGKESITGLSSIFNQVVELTKKGMYYKAMDKAQDLRKFETSGLFNGVDSIIELIQEISTLPKTAHSHYEKLLELEGLAKMADAITFLHQFKGVSMFPGMTKRKGEFGS